MSGHQSLCVCFIVLLPLWSTPHMQVFEIISGYMQASPVPPGSLASPDSLETLEPPVSLASLVIRAFALL